METARTYLPAAGKDWLLPLYDPIVKLLGGDTARKTLIEGLAFRSGERILDLGTGTGEIAIAIKQRGRDVEVIGIDPDPKALDRAKQKAGRAGVAIRFEQGFGDQLPYADQSFDRVLSSFVFHHLPDDQKDSTLREIRRVLKPGGEFRMADFEGPEDHHHGMMGRLFHSNHRLEGNSERRVLEMMKRAGFANVKKTGRTQRLLGGVAYYLAVA